MIHQHMVQTTTEKMKTQEDLNKENKEAKHDAKAAARANQDNMESKKNNENEIEEKTEDSINRMGKTLAEAIGQQMKANNDIMIDALTTAIAKMRTQEPTRQKNTTKTNLKEQTNQHQDN